jgi:hypothetical protein
MLCFMDVVECEIIQLISFCCISLKFLYTGHYMLSKEARILHRDISVGNLMYAVVASGEPRQSGTSGAVESRPVDWSQAIPDNPIHGEKETAQKAGKEDNKKSSRKVQGYLSDFDLSMIKEQDPRSTSDHRTGTTVHRSRATASVQRERIYYPRLPPRSRILLLRIDMDQFAIPSQTNDERSRSTF